MILISRPQEKKIPYHDKVINSYCTLLDSIHPQLKTTNPILSGSSAVKFLYCPTIESKDIDFYFQSFEDANNAFIILSEIDKDYYITDNAITFNTINIQIIKKFYGSPEDIITSHDFYNVACALTADGNIYTLHKTNYAWYNQELDLQNFQVPENPTPIQKIVAINNLLNRCYKYIERYDLTLSNKFKKFFYSIILWLEQNASFISPQYEQTLILDYYGVPVPTNTPSHKDVLIKKIKKLLKPNEDFSYQTSFLNNF